ncbi:MAG: ABC transporter permease [Ignavibacteriaceae bacterium]|nr:ABC transporter permease [Ignavibacteriaceae bacterium]
MEKLKRIYAITEKEFMHLFRDKGSLMLLLLFPVFLLGFFGFAVNFDVKNIQIGVYDLDNSQLSREMISSITASEYFNPPLYFYSQKEADKALLEKSVRAVVVIPEGLSEQLASKRDSEIQFLIDGVDANSANIIQAYLSAAIADFNQKHIKSETGKLGVKMPQFLSLEPVFWFNPELNSTWFLLPGLISMILVITSVISVSLSLVREKESGTIEQLRVSPAGSFELLQGKIIPYLTLSFINALVILLAGYLIFGLQLKGSFGGFLFATFIFLIACSSMGYFVSVISNSLQVAFTIGTFVSLLPSLLLSGFVFQIESMPYILQIFSNITPAKFFNNILRAIVLRGTGIETYVNDLIYLLIFSGVLIMLSVIISKKKAEN